MRVLPYLIQDSFINVIQLKVIVKYSLIGQSRPQLQTDCQEYRLLAETSIPKLVAFFIRTAGLIERARDRTNSTITDISNLYTDSKAKCNTTAAWMARTNDKLLVPSSLSKSPICVVPVEQVALHISDHISTLYPQIQLSLEEGILLLRDFNKLKGLINKIQDLAFQDHWKMNEQKANIIKGWSMW